MTMPGRPTAPPLLTTLRTMMMALMAAPVIILVVVAIVLPDGKLDQPAWLWVLVVLVAGAVAAVVVPLVGYNVPAIKPDVPADRASGQARTAFQSSTMLRFALSEAIAFVGLALAFVAPQGGLWVYLLGFVIAETLMFLYAWPSDAVIGRVQNRLDQGGAVVDLRSVLGSDLQ